ncbi:DNA-3-methyladenine glycosylase family protein [Candidatus Neomarinimicrobiota bacterium]
MDPENIKIIQMGASHLLNADKRFALLIERFGYPDITGKKDFYNALAKSIIYQQLSGKAAGTIYSRVLAICGNTNKLDPEVILNTPDDMLRTAGLSAAKTRYIKALASTHLDGGILPKEPGEMTNLEISESLTKIKGIGQWTADMFLIFTLVRPDILPLTDLGIKKGFTVFFGLKDLPDEKYMLKQASKWKPYRSIASWYLWEIVDNDFRW